MRRSAFCRPFSLAVVLLFAVLTLSLVGCGDSKEEKASSEAKQSQQGSDAQQKSPPPPKVKVVEVQPADVPMLHEYSASIQAKETVDIRARVAGYLQERHFEEGSMVTKGELLFTIDPREYEEDLKQAQSQLQRDQATLQKAKTDLQRFGELYKKGAISREEYDTRLTAVKQDEATVSQDEAAVKQAQLNLSYTKITAPMEGLIGRAQAQSGDLVGRNDNTLLATITTVDPVYVNFSISEQDYLSYVKESQERAKQHKEAPTVQLYLKLSDSTVYSHTGEINMVDPTVDPKTGTIGIRATFPNPEGLLKPGQFARVLLAVQRDDKTMVVPQRAVMDVQGMKMCLVASKDGKVQSKTVQLGQELGSTVVIKDGLEAGDLVLVEGLQKVKPGDTISPQVTQIDLKKLEGMFDPDDETGDAASQNATAAAPSQPGASDAAASSQGGGQQ